jgi:hypothetical protein
LSDIKVIIACDNEKSFYWDPLDEEATNPHVLITGTTGAGKTQLLMTISAELRKYNVPIIIFDKEGEYKKEFKIVNNIRIIDFQNIRLNPLVLQHKTPIELSHEIIGIFKNIFDKDMGPKQENLLREIIIRSFKRKGINESDNISTVEISPSFDDIKQILNEEYEKNPKDTEINGILARLNPLFDSQIFSGKDSLDFSQLLRPGINIIDLSKLMGKFGSDELLRAVVIFVSKKLWDYIYSLEPINKPILRATLVLDEGYYYTFKYSPIDQMIREGRKYGISIILASQLLKDFEENVINNTALKIALKAEDPSDRKKIMDTFKVNEKQLPSDKFEALVMWKKFTKLVKSIPYFEYNKYSNKEEICKEIKYNINYGTKEENKNQLKRLSEQNIEEPQDEEIQETSLDYYKLSLAQIIDKAVKERNIILLDAFYQFYLNPNSKSVGYGLSFIYSYIRGNLAVRYNLEEADKIVNYLKSLMKSVINEYSDNGYQIKGFIFDRLMKNGGLSLLKQDSLNRIKKLSEKDQLIIYSLLASCRERETYNYAPDISPLYKEYYKDELKSIDKDVSLDYALNLAIRTNIYSELMRKSSGRSGDMDEIFYSHDFIDDIINELNNINIVKSFKERFEKAVSKAIDLWNVEVLGILLGLNSSNPTCYKNNIPSIIVNGINGPERYLNILANHIRTNGTDCAFLKPSWLKNSLKNSISPLINHINETQEKTAEVIEDFIRKRIPDVSRESLKDGCFALHILNNEYKEKVIKICFDPIIDYSKFAIDLDNIYVTVLAPVNLCNEIEKSNYKLGLVISTPYKAISCSHSLDSDSKELFSQLIKTFGSNSKTSIF